MVETETETETVPPAETRSAFLRRGAVVLVVLAALAGLAVYLTSRSDANTARDKCTTAARERLAGPVTIAATDRTGDDDFLVRGSAGGQAFTCRVTRDPLSDRWEVAGVA